MLLRPGVSPEEVVTPVRKPDGSEWWPIVYHAEKIDQFFLDWIDGKYPNRPAVEPILHYQKKRGITLGIINGYYKLIKIKIILISLFFPIINK